VDNSTYVFLVCYMAVMLSNSIYVSNADRTIGSNNEKISLRLVRRGEIQ